MAALLRRFMEFNKMSLPEIVAAVHDLVDEREAAPIIGVKPATLSVWRTTGRYNLPYIKVGRLVRYRRSDLAAWLESRTRESGATA